MFREAIADTNVLIKLTYLKKFDIFQLLKNLFRKLHIPTEVRIEYERMLQFEPTRSFLLERLRPNEGFYSLCTRYDSLSLAIYKFVKGIDAGEAEAVAQHKAIGSTYIISDDERFRKSIKKIEPNVRVIGTLHLIVMLDLQELLPTRNEILKELFKKYPFKSSDLRKAYCEIAKELGLSIAKKKLNAKTSLKALGVVRD